MNQVNIDHTYEKHDEQTSKTQHNEQYVFDVNTNMFNPNKILTNRFLYKLNRRVNEMEHSTKYFNSYHRLQNTN